ncbi:MAG: hypothetical protein EOP39_27010 [Rubrivivax sp.]|nr:MAG: hypothetical protein EOP39_27010 [Rubrivivax sp.]
MVSNRCQLEDRNRLDNHAGVAIGGNFEQVSEANFDWLLPAERAGEIIANGIDRDAARILVGADAKIASLFERLMPVGYWRALAPLAQRR